jgi:hypothetical protein
MYDGVFSAGVNGYPGVYSHPMYESHVGHAAFRR